MSIKKIATHRQPDADALVSTWLAERFLFADEIVMVVFVGRAVPKCGWNADCVVDVGNEHDPARLRFDHKPPAFADRNETCATRLVWEHLQRMGADVVYLAALVEAVHAGDSNPPRKGSLVLQQSRTNGFHAFLRQARQLCVTDSALYEAVRHWLNISYDV